MVGNLTVVVPFYNGYQYIEPLIRSIPEKIPVVIVDDVSKEPLPNYWEGVRPVTVIRLTEKRYFAGAVNVGIAACETDVLVLNQDTWFENDLAFGLVDDLRNEGVAMTGERIKGTHPAFGEFGYIHGTFMFLRRDAIREVGMLNQRDYPLWGGTAEYQWRMARKGYVVKPLEKIPGFRHARPETERYGSSIADLLDHTPTHEKMKFVTTPPLLSVIVPCYNYGRYLQDCINSLIGGPTSLGVMPGQTLQSFEVVIVNDASTDDSAAYVDKLISPTKGIRGYHLQENVGTARTLNYGIERATGRYITFLSADDMREPWSLELLVRACQENPHSFAYDDVWLWYGHQRIKPWRMQDYDFETLLWKNQVHAGIVFPKRAWEEVGGYPGVMDNGREDWAFNIALGIHGWCGVHVKELGYLYRREDQNRSLTNTTQYHRELFLQKLKSLFPEIYGGQRPMACCGKGKGAGGRATALATLSARSARQSSTTQTMTGGASIMAAGTGSQGMVKMEYLGKQQSTIWDGPVTQVRYRFGVDRKTGWVDPRDAGERGTSGFLKLKDRHDNWLFKIVESAPAVGVEAKSAPQPVLAVVGNGVVSATVVERGQEVLTAVADPADQDVVSATVVEEGIASKATFPNPTDLYPSDIKRLNLTREQWEGLYRAELEGKNRQSVKTFVEEKLASE